MSMSSMQKLILAFVTLILGIVFVAQIADIGLDVTGKFETVDESFDYTAGMLDGQVNETSESSNITLTNAPTSWKVNDCPLTGVVVTNSSGTVLTLDTDYKLYASNGVISMLNTTDTNTTFNAVNTSLIDYTYCKDDYMNLTWGRTTINIVPGFFAIALLLVSVGLFYSIGKDTGIIN